MRACLRASSMHLASSGPRPKNPNSASVAAPTRRPGNGTDPATVTGSHNTSTASTGSGKPFNSNGPTLDERLGRVPAHHHAHEIGSEDLPALRRRAQRAASTTGSPK